MSLPPGSGEGMDWRLPSVTPVEFVGWLVDWLLSVQATYLCISEMDLLRQVYHVLPH